MGSINGKRWTDEQLEFMDYMLDTKRDTTLDGSPRCDYCYKGIDCYDDVEWMRCTESACVLLSFSLHFLRRLQV